jgi:hypothetical protein
MEGLTPEFDYAKACLDANKKIVHLEEIQYNLLYLIRKNCDSDVQRIAHALVKDINQ